MQFDKTLIAIRERSIVDTLDLALHVCRIYAWPLLVTMGLGVIPLALLNHLLLARLVRVEPDTPVSAEMIGNVVRFVWNMTLLIVIQAPLASAFATTYLGQAVFLEKPRIWTMVRGIAPCVPSLIWCHLLLRGVLPALFLAYAIDQDATFSPAEWLLVTLLLALGFRRATAPFLNEIVLLERNPLRAGGSRAMTVGRRSAMLHGPSTSDLIYRFFVASVCAVLLSFVLFGGCVCAQGVFWDDWAPGAFLIQMGVPLTMWLSAGFFTVVRFLSYLDLRIRQEGWEVELRMRAEGARLVGVMP